MSKTTIIYAKSRQLFPNFKEIRKYKDLFLTLAWRDFRVRYAQIAIVFLRAFIQPIVALTILTESFGRFAQVANSSVRLKRWEYTFANDGYRDI